LLYLRPNIQVEPLFDYWYAWSHLIPPATAARNMTERHFKIMDSYINAPQAHANAVKNPKLLGGPFGHACILLETPDINMLFDPVLSYTYESKVSRYTYEALPDSIDYVIITHNHQDHVLFETILQIRHKVKNFVAPASSGGFLQDPSLKLILKAIGCKNV